MAKRLKADERRQEIVRAARKLFTQNGYEATRVEEIAEAAGCTTGPVYHFFGTKREIYAAAVRAGIRDAAAGLAKVREQAGDGRSALDLLIHSCDHLLGRLSDKRVASFTLEAPRVLGIDHHRETFNKALLPFIESDLRTAMLDGEIESEPPEPLAYIIGGDIVYRENHIALATRGKSKQELERFREALTRLLERLRSA